MRDVSTALPGERPAHADDVKSQAVRDPKSGFLKPRNCQLYRAGHTVHWIQAIHSSGTPHRIGRLIDVAEIVITIDFGDEIKRYRSHEPERLLEIVESRGFEVRVCEEFVILRVDQADGSGSYCFSVVDADKPLIRCDNKPLRSTTPEALVERLETHGGFAVEGRALLGLLDEELQ